MHSDRQFWEENQHKIQVQQVSANIQRNMGMVNLYASSGRPSRRFGPSYDAWEEKVVRAVKNSLPAYRICG